VNAKKKPIPVSDEDQFIEEASLQLEEMLKIITDKCFLKIIIRPISKGSESEISFFVFFFNIFGIPQPNVVRKLFNYTVVNFRER
jgi:hypothetical protein